MEDAVPRPKCLRNVGPLPISPTREEEAKRSQYRKFLKIRTLVFCVLAVGFFSLGTFLIVRYSGPTGSSVARACGILFTVFGIAFFIITAVYCPTFTKLVSSRSASVAYHPKSAEALTKLHYPRQPLDKAPQILPMPVPLPQVLPMVPLPSQVFIEPSAPPPYTEFDKTQ
ncbi:hypothetical protein Aperf_G00000108091 [Anoplocephala perfoliata]